MLTNVGKTIIIHPQIYHNSTINGCYTINHKSIWIHMGGLWLLYEHEWDCRKLGDPIWPSDSQLWDRFRLPINCWRWGPYFGDQNQVWLGGGLNIKNNHYYQCIRIWTKPSHRHKKLGQDQRQGEACRFSSCYVLFSTYRGSFGSKTNQVSH